MTFISRSKNKPFTNRKISIGLNNTMSPNDMVMGGSSIVIQRHAPSIPYKDSSYGYEPIETNTNLLIDVGNSFKKTYKKQFEQTPGPG